PCVHPPRRGRKRKSVMDEGYDDMIDHGLEDDLELDESVQAAKNIPRSADDALGLYLRQMGAIPLLNREEELRLACKLERERIRFRRAVLSSWLTIRRVIETFDRVQSGQLSLDPTIDVVTSLKLSRDNIQARMPYNLKTLHHVLRKSEEEFKALMRTRSDTGRERVQRRLLQLRRKAI